jgi:hypothetical protein
MVCKANTRCILVWAECSYFQCSLLLLLLCTEVHVVGGYKLVERGIAPRSLCVGVFGCWSVRLVHCHCVVSSHCLLCQGSLPPLLEYAKEGVRLQHLDVRK